MEFPIEPEIPLAAILTTGLALETIRSRGVIRIELEKIQS
jgi:hypothetical protein